MPRPLPATDAPCPCGRPGPERRPLPYGRCCGPWHAGAPAPDAEALMRSRYSAYTLEWEGYLLDTWHPRTRPAGLGPFEPGLSWLGLEVRRHVPLDDGRAVVEFVARSKLGGRAHRLHETSRFERDPATGRWLYVDGDLR